MSDLATLFLTGLVDGDRIYFSVLGETEQGSADLLAAIYEEINKQWPWERTFTLDEALRLYAQEQRPENPYLLRMWKVVRHSKHYGSEKHIRELLDGR